MDMMKLVTTSVSVDIESCKKSKDKTKSIMKANDVLRNNIQSGTSKFHQEIMSKAKEILNDSDRQMEELNKEYREMEEQLATLEKQQELLESVQNKLNSAKSVKEAAITMAEADDISSNFKKEQHIFEALITKNENLYQNIQETIKNRDEKIREIEKVFSKSGDGIPGKTCNQKDPQIDDIVKETQNLHPFTKRKPNVATQPELISASTDDSQSPAKQYAVTRRQPFKITTESLLQVSNQVKTMIENGRCYVIQENEDTRRGAPISIYENKYVCLHSLRRDNIPPNATALQFEDIIRLIKPSERLVFLEFKNVVKDKILGKIIIKLAPNTKKGENFFFLCSAEKGPSYRNSCILVVGHRGTDKEGIWMGDYEMKFGEGGMSLVPGAGTETGNGLDQPWLAGTLGSSYGTDSTASQFGIITKDIPGEILKGCFGKVQFGFDILTDALQLYPNFEDEVIISDCGVIVNTI